VLWVKGSGGDLRTAARALRLARPGPPQRMRERYERSPDRGLKTPSRTPWSTCTSTRSSAPTRAPGSIDTPLHAFVSFRHVDHTHPDAVIAIAAAADGRATHAAGLRRRGRLGGLAASGGRARRSHRRAACAERPHLRGIVMGQHGLICWDDDDKGCYETSLELIERAGRFIEERATEGRAFGGPACARSPTASGAACWWHVLPTAARLGLVRAPLHRHRPGRPACGRSSSRDAPRLSELGTSCPDHFLRTKIKPLYVPMGADPDDAEGLLVGVEDGLERYRDDYRAYYRAPPANAPAMRDPNPTVILIPGVGMIAFGQEQERVARHGRVLRRAVEVMRGAESVGATVALPRPGGVRHRVLGARGGEAAPHAARARVRAPRGRRDRRRQRHRQGAAAHAWLDERAHVVCADLDEAGRVATARELTELHGHGIGVGGSGVVGLRARRSALRVDVTDRTSIRALIDEVVLAYGGSTPSS
jgi:rhamnose utilization protein RhaD (predicted bifunctional aldolase and dehydrogenase)